MHRTKVWRKNRTMNDTGREKTQSVFCHETLFQRQSHTRWMIEKTMYRRWILCQWRLQKIRVKPTSFVESFTFCCFACHHYLHFKKASDHHEGYEGNNEKTEFPAVGESDTQSNTCDQWRWSTVLQHFVSRQNRLTMHSKNCWKAMPEAHSQYQQHSHSITTNIPISK